ncbi:MAG: 50S ribosomal protein L23 [Deinococcaceae bacterium]
MNAFDVIKAPLISEKAYLGFDKGVYTFWVDVNATKTDIKQAVQTAFGVKVLAVNTQNLRGKTKRVGRFEGRRIDRKKAIIKLVEGQKIDALEGLI